MAAAVATSLSLAGCGLQSALSSLHPTPPPVHRTRVVRAGRLQTRWTRLRISGPLPTTLLLGDGSLFWVGGVGGRSRPGLYGLRLGSVGPSVSLSQGERIASLPFATTRGAQPILLAAVGPDQAVAASVASQGLEAGVVADTWLVGPGRAIRLVDLAPKGTRPRFADGQTVATGASGRVLLAVGADAASPLSARPARDVVAAVASGGAVARCPAPQAVPASLAWPAAGGGFVIADGSRLEALDGCPAGVRLRPLVSLPKALYPLLVGTRRTRGVARVIWVCGIDGTRLGTWVPAGRSWRRLWAVPSANLAVNAVGPNDVLVTADDGAHSTSILYQAGTGRTAGPWRDVSLIAAGGDSLVLAKGRARWIVRAGT